MVDGEGHACRRGNICRVGDLLKIGLHRNCHGKEGIVCNIERSSHPWAGDEGIGGEDDEQASIFDAHSCAVRRTAR